MNFVQQATAFLVTAAWLGLIDTGAVNGMVGVKQFVKYDSEVLKPMNLGCVRIQAPGSAGGVGGRAKVLGALLCPLAWVVYQACWRQ